MVGLSRVGPRIAETVTNGGCLRNSRKGIYRSDITYNGFSPSERRPRMTAMDDVGIGRRDSRAISGRIVATTLNTIHIWGHHTQFETGTSKVAPEFDGLPDISGRDGSGN